MDTRRPLPRPFRKDIVGPSIDDLIALALTRMCHIVQPEDDLPPVPFPLAECMRWDFFTHDDWDRCGNLETEHARLSYTLSRFPERGPPSTCEDTLRNLLGQPSVLTAWSTIMPQLELYATTALNDVIQRLHQDRAGQDRISKADCIVVPVDYEACKSSSQLTLRLWKRSLDEMATCLAVGDITKALQFLQIHAYLKDPIYGLAKPLERQLSYFTTLLERFQSSTEAVSLRQSDTAKIIAQAAQESSYLANPLLNNLTLIHFEAHHQLTYIAIQLDSLARAEFSVPLHVLEVAEEMLLATAANNGLACPIVPILVTTRPSISPGNPYLVPIIDGNHRVTAIHLLKFLATHPSLSLPDYKTKSESLISYCHSSALGQKWQIDLLDVLTTLSHPQHKHYRTLLLTNPLLPLFSTITSLPALLVQEEDFHTIDKQRSAGRSKPVLLHPFHQTVLNDDSLPFALPQKAGQAHGRPEGFRLMPLEPFGGGWCEWR